MTCDYFISIKFHHDQGVEGKVKGKKNSMVYFNFIPLLPN